MKNYDGGQAAPSSLLTKNSEKQDIQIFIQQTSGKAIQTVDISDFRANLLKYLEKANTGEHISVTTNGKLIATITPPKNQRQLAQRQLEQLAKSAKIKSVVEPIEAEWNRNL